VHLDDLLHGLAFQLPAGKGLATGLATFGIIGVGASELITYPYWCLEKGYARFTSPRDSSPEWAARARGWMRVMHWDAMCSMLIFTLATVAFYVLGATIHHRSHMLPSDSQMMPTLQNMYTQNGFFRGYGAAVFFIGAFAVLYSTFFVATAGNARLAADALRTYRISDASQAAKLWWTRLFCGVFPFLSLSIYSLSKKPVTLVLISATMQSIMLGLLGVAALYFRFRRCDPRIKPGRAWDACLVISVAALCVVAGLALIQGIRNVAAAAASIMG
jgi:hypothetical protein